MYCNKVKHFQHRVININPSRSFTFIKFIGSQFLWHVWRSMYYVVLRTCIVYHELFRQCPSFTLFDFIKTMMFVQLINIRLVVQRKDRIQRTCTFFCMSSWKRYKKMLNNGKNKLIWRQKIVWISKKSRKKSLPIFCIFLFMKKKHYIIFCTFHFFYFKTYLHSNLIWMK